MLNQTHAVDNRKKRRLSIMALIAAIIILLSALWAFFTDFNTGYSTVTAGSLDIKQKFELYHNDVLVGNIGATKDIDATVNGPSLESTATSVQDGNGNGVIENLNPGDTVRIAVTVTNYGTKSLWLRPSLRLTGQAIGTGHSGANNDGSVTEFDSNFTIYEQVSVVNTAGTGAALPLTQGNVKALSNNGYDGSGAIGTAGRSLGTTSGTVDNLVNYNETSGGPYDSAAVTAAGSANAIHYTSGRLFILNGRDGYYSAWSDTKDASSYYANSARNDTAATVNAKDAEYEPARTAAGTYTASGSNHFLATHTVTYYYTIYFKPTALNEMQGTNLTVGYLMEAVQYRNNTQASDDASGPRIGNTGSNAKWDAVDGWRDVVSLETENATN